MSRARPPAMVARTAAATARGAMPRSKPIQVLYSFPTRLGVPGIGTTAWHQAAGLAAAGVRVTVLCGSCERLIPGAERVIETMRILGRRVPYRALGLDRAMAWHDRRVAAYLRRAGHIDLVHCWPSGSLATLRAAQSLGIPTLLERPSAHTEQVYEVVARECRSLGLEMPRGHYGWRNVRRLRREEAEFRLASFLLCPSEFAAETFRTRGVEPGRIRLHQYGFDPATFRPMDGAPVPAARGPLKVIFVGECFPLKGLHFALQAWINSGAATTGTFYICGRFMPQYRDLLRGLLAHPSVKELGFVSDVASVMRQCDALVLPSLSEGSALVTYEARACGLPLLVSSASGAHCRHMLNALVHEPGDRAALEDHFRRLAGEPALLEGLRRRARDGLDEITWSAAATRLREIYTEAANRNRQTPAAPAIEPNLRGGIA